MEEYSNGIHDKYTRGNVLQIEKYYKNKSFDAVVLLGLMEHLRRSEGKVFMEKLEKLPRERLLFALQTFYSSGSASWNSYQEHIAGWYVNDFRIRGYKLME